MKSQFKVTLLASAICLLSACGGGGSPPVGGASILSGTAAGGAAVIGTVVVTDSLGATKGGIIEDNGHYSVDVAGMTGPFMLKAAGKVGNTSVTYYSAATSSDVNGTVNVTPFTNLIVSNIAAQIAEKYFSTDQHSNFATLFTTAKLATAQTELLTKLQPVLSALGVSNSIDLLRASFAADHSGIDAVLDLVKVQADLATNVVTLKNAIDGGTIATDDTTTNADNATPASKDALTGITKAAVTDLQDITTSLNNFAKLFTNSLPTPTQITKSGLFDTSSAYINNGQTFAEFAAQISTNAANVGMQFSNVTINLKTDGTTGNLTAVVKGTNWSNFIQQRVVKSAGGAWQIQGNGRLVDLNIRTTAEFGYWKNYDQSLNMISSGQDPIISGINFFIDPHSYNASHTALSDKIATAVVTGPGLISSGVVFENAGPNRWMRLPGYVWNSSTVSECGREIDGNGYTPKASQCIDITSAVDNSAYTLILKNAAGASLNETGYTIILPKQPLMGSSLSPSNFPALKTLSIDGDTNITPRSLVNPKFLAMSWTLPSGLTSNWSSIWASDATGAAYSRVEKPLDASATSTIFAIGTPAGAPTPNEASYWIEGKDAFGRTFGVGYYQKIN